jgi:hypothetical protein
VVLVEERIRRGRGGGLLFSGLAVLALGCAAIESPGPAVRAPDLEAGAALESMRVESTETPADIALRFAWPLPSQGRCVTMARRIEGTGAQVLRATSSLRAERDGDQIRVDTVDVEVPSDAPAQLLPLAETWHAERLVDGQGRLLRVQPLDPHVSPAQRSAMTARLAQRWQSMVSAWAGRTVPLGVTYSATAPEQTAEGTVRLQIAIRADGRVPCEPGAKIARCVRLRILSQPTAADAPGLARVVARDLLSPDAFTLYDPSRVRTFVTQTTVVLITDPETLQPRRVTERRTLQLRIDPLIGDDGVDVNRQDEVTTACAWSAP